jgi:hypothetical protein
VSILSALAVGERTGRYLEIIFDIICELVVSECGVYRGYFLREVILAFSWHH